MRDPKIFEPKVVLVTGGCGFIGSNFINYIFPTWQTAKFVNFDKIMEGASKNNICEEIRSSGRYYLVVENLINKQAILEVLEAYKIDTVIHFAALSHVDDSYNDRIGTIYENVMATTNLLEAVVEYGHVKRFVHISTDEVYGDSEENEDPKTETSVLNPTNPYAASKAAVENIVRCYYYSYNLPYVMVRMNNVFGPNQYETKLIPKFTKLACEEKPYTLRGDGSHSRNWIYVDDCAEAIRKVTEQGRIGEVYNIGSVYEVSNADVMKFIHKHVTVFLKRKTTPIETIDIPERPYHDKRYYIDFRKIQQELGWNCTTNFEQGLEKTIKYYIDKFYVPNVDMMQLDEKNKEVTIEKEAIPCVV